jgi:membrane protease YdiL (CAAX protease family)
LRGYLASLRRDARASATRVAHDRAALTTIVLILLPWLSLFVLRSTIEWVWQLAGIAVLVFSFWWMSRSASAAPPEISKPRVEFLFGAALVLLWMLWRVGICGKAFFFLPPNFECFRSLEFELIPKLIEQVIFPAGVLFLAGYGLRAQGLGVSLRAWWIAAPALLAFAAYGAYIHLGDPAQFIQRIGEYFLAAGLPEEVLFRAVILTRLEAWWRNPASALFASSVLFGLSHLPINYLFFTRGDWRETWITLLTFQMGFGVAFGFAYQRCRNVFPVALAHAMLDAL